MGGWYKEKLSLFLGGFTRLSNKIDKAVLELQQRVKGCRWHWFKIRKFNC